MSERLRSKCVRIREKEVLVARIAGTLQEADLSVPPNCNGMGRLRHFRRHITEGWPLDPLPIDPANKALGRPPSDVVVAQVFQLAACDWRCWYCFVPEQSRTGDAREGQWLSPRDLVEMYLEEVPRSYVIDLSGGSPNLAPEWVPWVMTELKERKLSDCVYLWSDDNLSNDFFWTKLSDADHELIHSYKNYGRVCCFKGYNELSFSYNTGCNTKQFAFQFEIMKRLFLFGLDLYGYVTLTTPSIGNLAEDMKRFVDRLQAVHYNLPLRVIPLLIYPFAPVKSRMTPVKEMAINNQWYVVEAWNKELESRYPSEIRETNIADIQL